MRIEKELPEVQKNILLKNYTTFKIGGSAKYFFAAKTKENLIKAIMVAKKYNLPFFILGGGSNLLVADKGFKGLVIKIRNQKSEIKNNKIFAEAGVLLSQLVNTTLMKKLTGLEWAAGIPGTVGGAIGGNAGAFGKSMEGIVKGVEVFDATTGKTKILKNKDCKFEYRDSVFKRKKNFIIISVILQLKKGNKKEIKNKLAGYLNYRKERQPLNFPSAGSVFKNPNGLSAGELIEKCGLKGKKIGNVKISERHANFIINLGRGRAKDVEKLINLVKKTVKSKFKIVLEEEINILTPKL